MLLVWLYLAIVTVYPPFKGLAVYAYILWQSLLYKKSLLVNASYTYISAYASLCQTQIEAGQSPVIQNNVEINKREKTGIQQNTMKCTQIQYTGNVHDGLTNVMQLGSFCQKLGVMYSLSSRQDLFTSHKHVIRIGTSLINRIHKSTHVSRTL